MAKVNYNQVNRKITLARKTQRMAEEAARDRFISAKNQMMDDFNDHPVTRELEDGSLANNISGTLGYGNLFTFIGFYEGEDPTDDIRQILNEAFLSREKKYEIKRNYFSFHYKVKAPTLDEIEVQTPYPDGWRGGSWTRGIEKGISNFPYYLFDDEDGYITSRSGHGIQIKNMVQNRGSFTPTQYISQILRSFQNSLKAG